MKLTLKVLKLSLALIILLTAFTSLAVNVNAATLLGASDYISDDTPLKQNVTHSVGFFIPPSGHTIVPTDYIRIIYHNFADVTAPSSGSGWVGAPVFGVSGNVATVTNVSASPDSGIGISGITATNPASDFSVTIQIANDAVGTIVYDSVTIQSEVVRGITTARVTISSQTSTITLSGYTSPGAFITFFLDNIVAGTTVADINGNFTKVFTGLNTNSTYNVQISAEDTEQRTTETVSFNVDTLPFINTVVSNILLPTTISLAPLAVTQGQIVTVEGHSHPFSQITIFLDGNNAFVVQADGSGLWSYGIDTDNLSLGTHTVNAKEIAQGGFESIFTQTLNFIVLAPQIVPTPVGTTATPIPGISITGVPVISGTPVQSIPPIIIIEQPQDGILDQGGQIIIRIIDDTGIDIEELEIILGDKRYTIFDPEIVFSGNPREYYIVFTPGEEYPLNEELELVIRIKDIDGNQSESLTTIKFSLSGLPATGGLRNLLDLLKNERFTVVLGSIIFIAGAVNLAVLSLIFWPLIIPLFLNRPKKKARVVNIVTKKGEEGANITVTNHKGQIESYLTDKGGYFTSRMQQPGIKTFQITKAGFLSKNVEIDVEKSGIFITEDFYILPDDNKHLHYLQTEYTRKTGRLFNLQILIALFTTIAAFTVFYANQTWVSLIVFLVNSIFLFMVLLIKFLYTTKGYTIT